MTLLSTGCISGGVLLGQWLQRVVPAQHLRDDSKETVKVGAGIIATLSSLVIGLLVSSAKSKYTNSCSVANRGTESRPLTGSGGGIELMREATTATQ